MLNTILEADCLDAIKYIESQGVKIDLIYIDPPFGIDVDKKFGMVSWSRNSQDKNRVDEIFPTIHSLVGVGQANYLRYMYTRLVSMREILSDNGSIYLHADWHLAHYLKVLLDDIFGKDNFLNEIVWSYNTRTMASKWFARKHDNILFYAKDRRLHLFNTDAVRIPHSVSSLMQYNKVDEMGKRYKQQSKGDRTYLNELGQPMGDSWSIQVLGSRDIERLGYATQKPEKLLEIIIKASSNEGSTILDLFGGSGTTAAVSNKLGRCWIVGDINESAIVTTRERMDSIGATYEYINLKEK